MKKALFWKMISPTKPNTMIQKAILTFFIVCHSLKLISEYGAWRREIL